MIVILGEKNNLDHSQVTMINKKKEYIY